MNSAIGVLDLQQGGIERPSERGIQPQIAEYERRTGQTFLKAGHGRKVDFVDIPAERLPEDTKSSNAHPHNTVIP